MYHTSPVISCASDGYHLRTRFRVVHSCWPQTFNEAVSCSSSNPTLFLHFVRIVIETRVVAGSIIGIFHFCKRYFLHAFDIFDNSWFGIQQYDIERTVNPGGHPKTDCRSAGRKTALGRLCTSCDITENSAELVTRSILHTRCCRLTTQYSLQVSPSARTSAFMGVVIALLGQSRHIKVGKTSMKSHDDPLRLLVQSYHYSIPPQTG